MDEAQAIPAVEAAAHAEPTRRRGGALRGILKFARQKPLGAFGFLLIFFLFAMTLGTPKAEFGWPALPDRPFGFELGDPWMQRYEPETNFYVGSALSVDKGPTAEHWLGTDSSGRDTWSRIVNGARRSMFVGIWALIVATVIGSAIGIISGYFGSWFDITAQRFMDAVQSFPPLIALILIVTINPQIPIVNDEGGEQSTLLMAAFALGFVGIPSVQRITRGVVLSVREQQYVESARVIGASDLRIMWGYILPNIFASIIVVFSTGVGVVILAEAALTFIVPDKLPTGISWGFMLSDSYASLGDAPWTGVFSAAAISVAVLGFNLAGDALRDVLDPRLRLR